MDFDLRMKNLSRLTPKKEMIAIMSDEYSKYYTEPANSILEKMWQNSKFQENLPARKAEKKLKFGNLSCLINPFNS
jgi:hypothetical protein